MDPTPASEKLPVPHLWQASVRRTIEALRQRTGLPSAAIAVARVSEATWSSACARAGSGATARQTGIEHRPAETEHRPAETEHRPAEIEHGLEVWLVARGQTYRYRIALPDGEPVSLREWS